MISKDSDLIIIRDCDARLKEYSTYKRWYEQPKTEFCSAKGMCANSFLPTLPPFLTFELLLLRLFSCKSDDQLPVSADGAIPDVHITAFVTTINSLLSNAPIHVLTLRKSVVNVVTTILDDVCSHSRRHSDSEGVPGRACRATLL